jgi:hypothetical protein
MAQVLNKLKLGMASALLALLPFGFMGAAMAAPVAPAPATPAVTQTYDPVPADVCASAPNNPACTSSSSDPITGNNGIIMTVANLLAWTAGGLGIIIIIFAGFRFVKSGGDASKVAQARETILYTVVGLVVIVLARLIVGLVISKL